MYELQSADPYTMMQDTRRSVRMDIFPVPSGDVDKNFAAAQAAFAKHHEELALGNSAVTKPAPSSTIRAAEPKFMCRRFLMGTLVELGNISATEALAKTSEFLCEKSAAQITKDGAQTGRASKHALVSVPVGGLRLQCTVRFKVYRTDSPNGGSSCLVLEITRRSGDAVAFGHFSIRAKDYLLQRPMSEIPAPPPLEAFLAKSGVNYPQDGMPGLLGMPDEVAVAVLATPM
jgi:hypothetical protein